MEQEGFLDATPKGISANYTIKEDKMLCQAWKKIDLDPVIGIEQPMSTYWNRMYE